MNTEKAYEILRSVDALAPFTDDELHALVAASKVRVILSGQPLWSMGESRSSCFFLLSGTIERRIQTYNRTVVETFKNPGEVMSWSALVGKAEYYSGAYASERAEVLVLQGETFQQLFEDDEAVAYALIDLISTYLVEDMRAANQRLKDVFGRPAETLRMLRRRVREDKKA